MRIKDRLRPALMLAFAVLALLAAPAAARETAPGYYKPGMPATVSEGDEVVFCFRTDLLVPSGSQVMIDGRPADVIRASSDEYQAAGTVSRHTDGEPVPVDTSALSEALGLDITVPATPLRYSQKIVVGPFEPEGQVTAGHPAVFLADVNKTVRPDGKALVSGSPAEVSFKDGRLRVEACADIALESATLDMSGVKLTDTAGQVYRFGDEAQDFKAEKAGLPEAMFESDRNTGKVIDGEHVRVKIARPEGGTLEGKVSFGKQEVPLQETPEGYLAEAAVEPGTYAQGEAYKVSAAGVAVKLPGGSQTLSASKTWTYQSVPQGDAAEFLSDTGEEIAAGSRLTVRIAPDREASVSGSVRFGRDSVELTKEGSAFTASYTVPEGLMDGYFTASLENVVLTDDAGQTEEITGSHTWTYTSEEKILKQTLTASREGDILIRGDTITFEAAFSFDPSYEGELLIGGESVRLMKEGHVLRGVYSIRDMAENSTVTADASGLVFRSPSGKTFTPDLPVRTYTYQGSLQVSGVQVSATREGGELVDGDAVVLAFTSNIQAAVSGSVRVAGKDYYPAGENGSYALTLTLPLEGVSGGDTFSLEGRGLSLTDSFGQTVAVEIPENAFTYRAPLAIRDVAVSNSRNNPESVFDGDTVTVRFRTARDAQVTGDVLIAGRPCAPHPAGEPGLYEASLTIEPGTLTEGAEVAVDISALRATDPFGQTALPPENPKGYIYREPIEFTSVSLDNGRSQDYIINGDTITFSFDTLSQIEVKGEILIGGVPVSLTGEGGHFSASLAVADGMFTEGQHVGVDASGAVFTDIHGQEKRMDTVARELVYHAPIEIRNFRVQGQRPDRYVLDGQEISVSFETAMPVRVRGNALIGNRSCAFEGENLVKDARARFSYPETRDGEEIPVRLSQVSLSDPYGQTATLPQEETVFRFVSPLEITPAALASSSGRSSAVDGDTLVLTVRANRDISLTGPFLIGGIPVSFSREGEWIYTARLPIRSGMFSEGEAIKADLSAGSASDFAGQTLPLESPESAFTYHAPVRVTALSASCERPDGIVLAGQRVTVTLETAMPATPEGTVRIGRERVSFTQTGASRYTASAAADPENYRDGERITIDTSGVRLTDSWGQAKTLAGITDAFTYVSPLEIRSFSVSTSSGKDYLLAGDRIAVSFSANRDAEVSGSVIFGGHRTALEGGPREYSASYEIRAGVFDDRTRVSADTGEITLTDAYGQTARLPEASAGWLYHAPIRVLSLEAFSRRDDSVLLEGDRLTVRFRTENPAEVTGSAVIGGREVPFTQSGNTWTASTSFKKEDLPDGQAVTIDLSGVALTDSYGQTGVPGTLSKVFRFVHPLSASDVTIASSRGGGDILDGTTVRFSFTVNHEATVSGNARLGSKEAAIRLVNGVWTASIPVRSGDFRNNAGVPASLTRVTVKDRYGQSVRLSESVKYTYRAPVKAGKVSVRNSRGDSNLTDGTVLWLSFSTDSPAELSGAGRLGSERLAFAKGSGNIWQCEYTVGPGKFRDGQAVTIDLSGITLTDAYGQTGGVSLESARYTYRAPFTVTSAQITSSRDDNELIDGASVRLTAEANRAPARVTGAFRLGTARESVSVSGRRLDARIGIRSGMFRDGQRVQTDTASIHLTDAYGQTATIEIPAREYTYHSPLTATRPVLTSSGEGRDILDGDTLTLSFSANRPARLSGTVRAAGSDLKMTGTADFTGSLSIEPGTLHDGQSVSAQTAGAVLTDAYGQTARLEAASGSFTYHSPLEQTGGAWSNARGDRSVVDGSTVTVNLTFNRDAELSGRAEISGREITFSRTGPGSYKASLRITPGMFSDGDELRLTLSGLKATDAFGQEADVSIEAQPFTYTAALSLESGITGLSFTSSNPGTEADGTAVCRNGDTLTVSLESSHALTVRQAVIAGRRAEVSQSGNRITAAAEASGLEDQSMAGFTLVLTDGVQGNPDIRITEADAPAGIRYYAPLETSAALTAPSGEYALSGEVLTLTVSVSHATVSRAATIAGQAAELTGSGTLTASAPVPEGTADGETLGYTVSLSDAAGNTFEDEGGAIRYISPLEVSELTVSSSRDDGYLTEGTVVSASFEANREVSVDGQLLLGAYAIPFTASGGVYEGRVEITSGMFADGETVSARTDGITLTDAYGQTVRLEGALPSWVYHELLTPSRVGALELSSSNPGSDGGFMVCRNGDVLTVHVSAPATAEVREMRIGSQSVRAESDATGFTGMLEVSSGTDQEIWQASAVLADPVEEDNTVALGGESSGSVRYFAPLTVSSPRLESSNTAGPYAIDGDTVTMRAGANHNATPAQFTIAGQDAGAPYGADIEGAVTVSAPTADQGEITGILTLTDAAGNISETAEAGGITYYAPIQASEATVASDNPNSPGVCKDGDSITLSFTANHEVKAEGSFGGKSISGSGTAVSVDLSPSGAQDKEELTAEMTLTDAAGNAPVTVAPESGVTYYAPIEASARAEASWSKTQGYVKRGDALTVHANANHEVTILSGSVNGTAFSGDETASSVSRIIRTGGDMQEGPVSIRMTLTDPAGNMKELTQSLSATYDGTAPEVSVGDLPGLFTNGDVKMRAEYKDAFLKEEDTHLYVNDQPTATANKTEEGFSRNVTVKDEGSFGFTADAEDLAGNAARRETGKVIIDKTDPKVTAIDLDLDRTPAYAAGFRLSDHFHVEESYLKDLSVLLSGRAGNADAKVIQLDTQIRDEGLQKAEITASDMAGNSSKKVDYSFYIDGTAPKAIVTVKGTNQTLSEEDVNEIDEKDDLAVELDALWMGDEAPDHLTKCEVGYEDGQVDNIILDKEDVSQTEIPVREGAQTLTVAAADDVGNTLEPVTYKISKTGTVSPETLTSRAQAAANTAQTGMFVAGGTGAATALVCGGLLLIRKKREEEKEAAPAGEQK